MDYINLQPNQDVNETGLIYELDSLYAYLQQVLDPRHPKGKLYPLALLLLLMVLAKLAGEDKPSGIADWVAHRVDQLCEMKILPKRRAPRHMTFRRLLQHIVDPEAFESLMQEYHRRSGCPPAEPYPPHEPLESTRSIYPSRSMGTSLLCKKGDISILH